MSSSASNRPQDAQLGPVHPIPRFAGTVLWQQLRADLFSRIENGALPPGAALPSETALAEAYKVNRLTVRRALADLTRAGIVRTEHGVGSFVASQPLRHRIDDGQLSLLESMANGGHAVRQLVFSTRRVDPHGQEPASPASTASAVSPASADLADLTDPAGAGLPSLVLSPDRDAPQSGRHIAAEQYGFPDFPGAVMEYRYIRWVDELPWSVSFAAVPEALAPPTWDGTDSLFAAMSARYGIAVRRDERCFSAVPADPQDAAWLEVQVGTPLLLLKGTNCNAQGQAVAHIVHRIRGDRAEYAMRVPR